MAYGSGERLVIKSPIDLHTHLREPGGEAQETIASGTRAALAGGYQMVCDMPNNAAPYQTWNRERVDEKAGIIARTARTNVGVYGGVDFANPSFDEIPRLLGRTLGSKFYMGFTTNNTAELTLDDVREYADRWIDEAAVRGLRSPILLHAAGDNGAETAQYIAARDHPVHWCHVSTRREVYLAYKLGHAYPELFSAGVTPHHLTMTSLNADFQQGWNGARMMPPLGTDWDHEALLYGYNQGYLQVLETDHAPHTEAAKLKAETDNPLGETGEDCTSCYGVSGIEFVLPIMTALVQRGKTSLERVQDSLYDQPLRTLRLRHLADTVLGALTTLEVGPWVIGEGDVVGASRNTPYVNWTAGAKVVSVEYGGRVMYDGTNMHGAGSGVFIYPTMKQEAD